MSARPARHNAARITDGREVGRSFWAASDLVGSAEQSSGPRHARQSSASKYAAHIGRVGALAVFLGVGLAAANGLLIFGLMTAMLVETLRQIRLRQRGRFD